MVDLEAREVAAPVTIAAASWWGPADLGTAGGVGAVAAAIFASTFSAHVALGDAPESVTGVHSLGILHAPGYVTYVVVARLFGEVVPFGSWEFRVNLFSLVCAAFAVAVLVLVARGFGANRIGAAVGGIVLATSVSFWFNAGFAKYYAFSALLIAVIVLCVLQWRERRRPYLLVMAGVLAGSTVGVSWQIQVIVTVALIVMLGVGSPRPGRRIVLTSLGAGLVTAAAVCVYVLLRAHQDPVMNFGDATNGHRLVELLSARDFAGVGTVGGSGIATFIRASPQYPGIVVRDVGFGAIVLAVIGGIDLAQRRRFDIAAFCALLGLGNLVGVGLETGRDATFGFYPGLVIGGQLVGLYIVIALLAALGATRILGELHASAPNWMRAGTVGAMVLVAIAPSLVVHHEHADHRIPPLAADYARRVLAQLPPNSVLLAGGWEFGQPIIERQVVHGERPDVTVVAADALTLEWYRDELVHRLGLDPALVQAPAQTARVEMIDALRRIRPVYEDTPSMSSMGTLFAYEPEGLVARLVAGTPGPKATPDIDALAAALWQGQVQDGITTQRYNRFPNTTMVHFYERAHVELAKVYALDGNLDRAADELDLALRFAPAGTNSTPITDAREHEPYAVQVILGL